MQKRKELVNSDLLEELWDEGFENDNLDPGDIFNKTIEYCRDLEQQLASLPKEQSISDEEIEKWAKGYCFENGYSLKQDIALVRDALKAMRDGQIPKK